MTGWDGFAKYVGVQGIIAILLILVIAALLLTARPVPPEVYGFAGVALGFYFAKNGYAITKSGIVQYPPVEK